MINPLEFVNSLNMLDIRFVVGVPDSLLRHICACITKHFSTPNHVIANSEGSAIGLAIGHYLATQRPALVYMQNSGLGNAVNPLVSLADPTVFGIPMILMVGWRGEVLDDGKQLPDEPQHLKQGKITVPQLEILEIPYRILDGQVTDVNVLMSELTRIACSRSGPVAIVVRKQAFASFEQVGKSEEIGSLTREEAITQVVDSLPDDVAVVCTTGMASRELFEIRKVSNRGHHRDFLTVGGMGHAGQIAAGIALARPDRFFVCIDGDGAALMNLGGNAIIADCSNLVHIVINNGAYDSVGGQPTKGWVVDFTKIAKACGYGRFSSAITRDQIRSSVISMIGCGNSSLLEVKCKRGSRADLGRPERTPGQNKKDFVKFLRLSKQVNAGNDES